MRKILLGLITGIFVLPVLCESYVSSIEAQVKKLIVRLEPDMVNIYVRPTLFPYTMIRIPALY